MKKLRQKSLAALSEGLKSYENQFKKADFTDFKRFSESFLNEPDKKRRKKLADEFRKRHAELYQFLKEHPELVASETEMSRMISAAVSSETVETDSRQLSNLMEMIEESMTHDVQ
ncbi:MAG: hypothetical protein IJ642_12155 [Oscillospiraceae bacterium]|nr:hypothetical protein [Oscillospiraceae bacterium]